jgi:hypothetical protein
MTLTPRGQWVLATLVVILVAILIGWAFSTGQDRKEHRTGLIPPVSITCQEDMPCWDCNTMGNLKCGKNTR